MSEQTASDISARMIQPTSAAPCAGCGEMVETAIVLGRTVYACNECAKPQVFVCGEDGKEEA